jgi:hypothetical protein
MTTFDNKYLVKSSKSFLCMDCNFETKRKYNYDQHLLTAKHQKTTFNNIFPAISSKKFHKCKKCDKVYKDRAGVWRHEKKCNIKNNIPDTEEINKLFELRDKDELILHLLKQNGDLQKSLIEMTKEKKMNNCNNMNNSHNKTFNLHFFLNETCKDALNISEFVSIIKLSLEDLENTGRRGYIEGISNIILKNLKSLEHHERPIHCSDIKREIMYIKDDNEWKKESEEKPILTKAIKVIANENIKKIKDWKELNPDCTDIDSKKNNLYLKIVRNSMSGSDQIEADKNLNKIISNVAKETMITKDS